MYSRIKDFQSSYECENGGKGCIWDDIKQKILNTQIFSPKVPDQAQNKAQKNQKKKMFLEIVFSWFRYFLERKRIQIFFKKGPTFPQKSGAKIIFWDTHVARKMG